MIRAIALPGRFAKFPNRSVRTNWSGFRLKNTTYCAVSDLFRLGPSLVRNRACIERTDATGFVVGKRTPTSSARLRAARSAEEIV
jgi:hypothetical protein